MGITKTEGFTQSQNEMAIVLKALGHPARVAILEHLLAVNNCICDDLVNTLPLAQATISQHLKELKNAELIKGQIEGKAICYCVNHETIEKLKIYFSKIDTLISTKKCC